MKIEDTKEAVNEEVEKEQQKNDWWTNNEQIHDNQWPSVTSPQKFFKLLGCHAGLWDIQKKHQSNHGRNVLHCKIFFVMQSLFFTFTLDNECSFRVMLYVNTGNIVSHHNGLASLCPRIVLIRTLLTYKFKCNLCQFDGDLILDLKCWKWYHPKYPGYCFLEYQSAMQIVLQCLFGWDTTKQCGNRDILGISEAFCRADEEKGRFTLYGHWLLWVKNFGLLWKLVNDNNSDIKESARCEYSKYINDFMSVHQEDFEIIKRHICTDGKEKWEISMKFMKTANASTSR